MTPLEFARQRLPGGGTFLTPVGVAVERLRDPARADELMRRYVMPAAGVTAS